MAGPVVVAMNLAGRITTIGGCLVASMRREDIDAFFALVEAGDIAAVLTADWTPTGEAPLAAVSLRARAV